MAADYGSFVNAALLIAGDRAAAGPPASFVGALAWFVGMDNIEGLDAMVRNLHTDVLAVELGPAPNPVTDPDGFGAWLEADRWVSAFRWKWVAFSTAWGQWVDDHYSTLSRTGEDAVQQFEQFQSQYNEHLRTFTEEFPGETKAEKSEQKPTGGTTEIPSTIKWASAAVIAVAAAYGLSKAMD